MSDARFALRRAAGARPMIVGHRGASGFAPENTLTAFELAAEQGVDFVECDVHVSRDGRLVVIHDDTVDRTTDGAGRVRDLTVAELQRLDAGSWLDARFRGTRIPTLVELFAWSTERRVPVAIELKQPDEPYRDYEALAVRAIESAGMLGRAMVISFDHDLLARVKAINPAVAAGMVYGEPAPVDPVAAALAIGAEALHPRFDLVTPELVAAAHAAGVAVSAWTLDPQPARDEPAVSGEPAPTDRAARPPRLSAERVERVLRTGLDSAATNYPSLLKPIIARTPPV